MFAIHLWDRDVVCWLLFSWLHIVFLATDTVVCGSYLSVQKLSSRCIVTSSKDVECLQYSCGTGILYTGYILCFQRQIRWFAGHLLVYGHLLQGCPPHTDRGEAVSCAHTGVPEGAAARTEAKENGPPTRPPQME